LNRKQGTNNNNGELAQSPTTNKKEWGIDTKTSYQQRKWGTMHRGSQPCAFIAETRSEPKHSNSQ